MASMALYINDQYVGALNTFAPMFDKCTFNIYETIVDIKIRTAAMRLRATIDSKAIGNDESAGRGYTAEYVYITDMDESGEKVLSMEEFIDPLRLLGYVLGKAERYNKMHSSERQPEQVGRWMELITTAMEIFNSIADSHW